jgi:hypothetical protein
MHWLLRPAPAIAAAALLCGCNPFGDCTSDRIDVFMSGATLEAAGTSHFVTLSGTVTDGNVGSGTYDRLVNALIDGSGSAIGATWTLEQGLPEPGWLAMTLGVEPQQGATVPIVRTYSGGGWGFSAPPADPALVSFTLGEFTANAVSGAAEVIQEAPLILRVDLTLFEGAADTVRVTGDMTFMRTLEDVSCS